MIDERITRADVSNYKREIMEAAVLVTVETAADMLSVSKSTVHRIIEEGRITPYDRTGRITPGVRLRAADVRDYVRSIRIDG